MGGGVGLIDVNQDGLLDLFFANGGPIVPTPGVEDPPCRLFLNEGNWRFREITSTANAPGPSYAMGCAVGDYDGDGRDDLFVTGWRDQKLYRNLGGGTFEDVTIPAGLSSQGWSTSAAFGDLDLDGDLDLYVCQYVDFDPARAPYCAAPDGRRDYCGPEDFTALPDHLYRNNGNGTFSEVSNASRIHDREGRGLGVVIADLTGDRLPDLFVANDGTPCRLYQNRGGLTFAEVGTEAGVALDGEGRNMAGMGIAVGDWSGDQRPDLVVTNFLGRSTIAFSAQGEGLYVEDSGRSGLAAATRSVLGFGVALADLDVDGDLDLIQANGHVLDRASLGVPFAMKSTLLRNDRGRFVEEGAAAGEFFQTPILGRGLAIGDLDHDGRLDVVIVPLDGPVALLKNQSPGARGVSVKLDGVGSGPGTILEEHRGERTTIHAVVSGGSYLSSHDRRIFLGGNGGGIDYLVVKWGNRPDRAIWLPFRSPPFAVNGG